MVKDLTMGKAISRFAAEATKKLSAIGAQGEPEDQIRSPLEGFIHDLADICRIGRNNVVAIGESSIADLKTRPDYAVQCHGILVGFIEVKAPGKGADPRKFKNKHDQDQAQGVDRRGEPGADFRGDVEGDGVVDAAQEDGGVEVLEAHQEGNGPGADQRRARKCRTGRP